VSFTIVHGAVDLVAVELRIVVSIHAVLLSYAQAEQPAPLEGLQGACREWLTLSYQ
jgi:hypothetical protein